MNANSDRQAVHRDAPSLQTLSRGADFIGRVWDVSGVLSDSFDVHRALMTDCSVFLIAWDIRLSGERHWDDHVLRYIRYVRAAGVANCTIVIVATHADCIQAENREAREIVIRASIAGLKEYLKASGVSQFIDEIILPADETRAPYVAAQLALAIINHGLIYQDSLQKQQHSNKMMEKFCREDRHCLNVTDLQGIFRHQPRYYAEEEARNLVRMGEVRGLLRTNTSLADMCGCHRLSVWCCFVNIYFSKLTGSFSRSLESLMPAQVRASRSWA